jgi:Lipocalin-like domain
LSDADKTITFHIETSTHPNWDATEQKRTYNLSADMLTYSGGSAVVGGSTVTLVWKRAN